MLRFVEPVMISIIWRLEPPVLFDNIWIKPLPLLNWVKLIRILPEDLPHRSEQQRIPEIEDVHADETQIDEVQHQHSNLMVLHSYSHEKAHIQISERLELKEKWNVVWELFDILVIVQVRVRLQVLRERLR